MRLWVDTDVGTNPDDAVTLLCAAGHPDVDLAGVSTVDGDTEWRAAIARELVASPVVAGAHLTVDDVRRAEPDALLAIGPLTNVAGLLRREWRPPRLAVMGGVLRRLRHRGRTRVVEHNFGSDPDSARAVLDALEGVLVCPLDVTARMRLPDRARRRLVAAEPALDELFDEWIERQRSFGVPPAEAGVCLNDPLALLALLGEPGIRVEQHRLTVKRDGSVRERDAAQKHTVVVDADVDASMERIVALVERASR